MSNYQLKYLISPTKSVKENKAIQDRVTKLLTTELSGTISKQSEPEVLKLSYPVKKQTNAYVINLWFELDSKNLPQFQQEMQLDTEILRHFINKQTLATDNEDNSRYQENRKTMLETLNQEKQSYQKNKKPNFNKRERKVISPPPLKKETTPLEKTTNQQQPESKTAPKPTNTTPTTPTTKVTKSLPTKEETKTKEEAPKTTETKTSKKTDSPKAKLAPKASATEDINLDKLDQKIDQIIDSKDLNF